MCAVPPGTGRSRKRADGRVAGGFRPRLYLSAAGLYVRFTPVARLIAFIIIFIGLAAGFPAPAGAAAPELALTAAGPAEMVFRWRTDACAPDDIPDAPARAFRDEAGTVHLFAAHYINRALLGSSLDAVRPDCAVAFMGDKLDDPEKFDDRIWLAAFHTDDGRTIAALAHAEFHGHRRPALCPSRQYSACWWNAVLGLVSHDGGRRFERAPGAGAVVAALPYAFDASAGRPTGYFGPSNILTLNGAQYAFVFAEEWRDQKRGACLLRTRTPLDPTSWRAWDGAEFAVALTRAGASDGPPAKHVCTPVPGLGSTMAAIVRHAPTGAIVGLFAAKRRNAETGTDATGIWYATSRDLLRWSEPRLLLEAPLMFAYSCGAKAVYAYPSLLDPASASRNFDSVSGRAYLYLTRFNMAGCTLTMDRDLVRFPVRIAPP